MKLNETGDPTELKDQVKRIFDEWIRLSDELPGDESFDTFVAGLQQIGFLKVPPRLTTMAEIICKRSVVRAILDGMRVSM